MHDRLIKRVRGAVLAGVAGFAPIDREALTQTRQNEDYDSAAISYV